MLPIEHVGERLVLAVLQVEQNVIGVAPLKERLGTFEVGEVLLLLVVGAAAVGHQIAAARTPLDRRLRIDGRRRGRRAEALACGMPSRIVAVPAVGDFVIPIPFRR